MLSRARRLVYSAGTFGSSLLHQTVLLWAFYYYAPPPGAGLPIRVEPALLGVAMGLGRIVDALADPLVASWSDARRAGARRRPYILAGAPLLALTFLLLWRPPHEYGSPTNFWYLAALLGAFYFVFTLTLNPYLALLPEIAPTARERVTTSAWQAAFSLGGTAAAFVVSSWLATRVGFAVMGLALAPVGMLPLVLAAVAAREPPVDSPPLGLRTALGAVLGHRAFRVFITGFALLWLGLSMVNMSLALAVTVLMRLPQGAVGTVLGIGVAATILTTPAVARLAHRVGSHRALVAAMAAACGLLPLIASIGLWPLPLGAPAQGYIVIVLAGPVLAALFTLPNAILAGITQDLARASGQRLEGMFFAFQGLILNGATGVSSLVLGGALSVFGYETGLRVVPLLAAACVLAGIAAFRRFPRERDPSAPA